jgi:hypothetical protein
MLYSPHLNCFNHILLLLISLQHTKAVARSSIDWPLSQMIWLAGQPPEAISRNQDIMSRASTLLDMTAYCCNCLRRVVSVIAANFLEVAAECQAASAQRFSLGFVMWWLILFARVLCPGSGESARACFDTPSHPPTAVSH